MKRMREDTSISRLKEEKKKVETEIQRLRSYLESEIEPSSGAEDDDSVDAASAIYEREKTLALIRALEDKALSIQDALRKVKEGTYGICEMCGEEIDPARLEIMPHTSLCVRCQAKAEAGARRSRQTINRSVEGEQ